MTRDASPRSSLSLTASKLCVLPVSLPRQQIPEIPASCPWPMTADGRDRPLEEHVESSHTPRLQSRGRSAVGFGLELAAPACSGRLVSPPKSPRSGRLPSSSEVPSGCSRELSSRSTV
jgi:hypothetical protein